MIFIPEPHVSEIGKISHDSQASMFRYSVGSYFAMLLRYLFAVDLRPGAGVSGLGRWRFGSALGEGGCFWDDARNMNPRAPSTSSEGIWTL